MNNRCVVCNTPTSARIVVEDDTNELVIWVCQEHGVDMANVRIHA